MAREARVDIASRRNEARTLTIRFVGVDWRTATFRQQVRLGPDTPGAAMLTLGTVTSANAEGVRVAGFAIEDGAPVTTVTLRYNMTTMRDLIPYSGELGDDARFGHAIQVDGVTRLAGDWWAVGSVMDSDAAPAARPSGFGGATRAPGIANAIGLTFAGQEVISVSIDGVELLRPLVAQSTAAAASASVDGRVAAAAAASARADAISAGGSEAAIAAAIAGYPNGQTLAVPIASRALLAAIAAPAGAAIMYEDGRAGVFVWKAGDQSALVAHDPRQIIAVPKASNPSGTQGAWVRDHDRGSLWAKWAGARGDGRYEGDLTAGTDDTAAIQATLDLLAYLGGGTVLFEDRVHILAGELKDPANSKAQLVIPKINDFDRMIAIRFCGTTPQNNGIRGTVLRSILTAGNGAVIGCKNPRGTGDPDIHEVMSYVHLFVEDLSVECPQNPQNSGIDARFVYNLVTKRVFVNVTGGRGHQGIYPALYIERPTNPNSYGILGSFNNAPLWNILDDTVINGFYTGVRVGELTTSTNLCFGLCDLALELPGAQHPSSFGRVEVLQCRRGMAYAGDVSEYAEIKIQNYDVEKIPDPDIGWYGQPYGDDVYDPNNCLRGTIDWHNHNTSVPFQVAGAMRMQRIRSVNGPRFSIRDDFVETIAGPGCVEDFAPVGRAPWFSGVTSTTIARDAAVGVFTGSNMAKAGTDKILGQFSWLTDGSMNIGRGQISIPDPTGSRPRPILHFGRAGHAELLDADPGSHHTQAAQNSDISGFIKIEGATSAIYAFFRPYEQPPAVVLAPLFDLGAGVRWWVSALPGSFTIHTSAPVTGFFAYHVRGAPY